MKIRYASDSLEATLGRAPTVSEISEASGYSTEEIAEAEIATSATDSLNREINEDGQTLEDVLNEGGNEDRMLEYISLHDTLKLLPPREKTVLELRFFRGLTQDRCAKIMSISQVQVSRIERAAIKKLREKL